MRRMPDVLTLELADALRVEAPHGCHELAQRGFDVRVRVRPPKRAAEPPAEPTDEGTDGR